MRDMDNNRGSITVETIISLSMLLMFLLVINYLVDATLVQARVQGAIAEVAKDLSSAGYVVSASDNSIYTPMGTEGYSTALLGGDSFSIMYEDYLAIRAVANPDELQSNVQKLTEYYLKRQSSTNYLQKMGIVNGFAGIDFSQTTCNLSGDGSLVIAVSYDINIIRLPFFGGVGIKKRVTQTAVTKLWKE